MSVSVKPQRVAFIGLGVMGYPMAGHLVAAGHDVHVFNRTADVAQRFVGEHAATAHATPADAVRDCTAAFACVGNDESVRDVVLGEEGVFAGLSAGALFVDHTTASATLARELAERGEARNLMVVDAPVSGW